MRICSTVIRNVGETAGLNSTMEPEPVPGWTRSLNVEDAARPTALRVAGHCEAPFCSPAVSEKLTEAAESQAQGRGGEEEERAALALAATQDKRAPASLQQRGESHVGPTDLHGEDATFGALPGRTPAHGAGAAPSASPNANKRRASASPGVTRRLPSKARNGGRSSERLARVQFLRFASSPPALALTARAAELAAAQARATNNSQGSCLPFHGPRNLPALAASPARAAPRTWAASDRVATSVKRGGSPRAGGPSGGAGSSSVSHAVALAERQQAERQRAALLTHVRVLMRVRALSEEGLPLERLSDDALRDLVTDLRGPNAPPQAAHAPTPEPCCAARTLLELRTRVHLNMLLRKVDFAGMPLDNVTHEPALVAMLADLHAVPLAQGGGATGSAQHAHRQKARRD